MKKKKGNINYFLSFAVLLLVVLIVNYNLKIKLIKTTKGFIEDGLVASNLASALIDLEEYGTTNKIINKDFNKSYDEIKSSLKYNLKLNNDFQPLNDNLINSKIKIDKYSIYNVIGNDVHLTSADSLGNITTLIFPNGLGKTKTPDGVLIKSTTMYCKISFKIRGYLNTEHEVSKENSVDITDDK